MTDDGVPLTLLCGASSPVGQGIAHVLDKAGHRLALQYKSNSAAVDQLLPRLDADRGHVKVGGDFTEPDGARNTIAAAETALGGRITGVVNAAWPSGPDVTVEKAVHDAEAIERSLDGYRMHASLCGAVLPSLRETHGCLVFIGAAAATRIHPELGLFGASKAAATVLSRVLALEEGPSGVRVNVVAPGFVQGGAQSSAVRFTLEEISKQRRPFGPVTPEQLGEACAWLLSPAAVSVTGQIVSLAGGEPI
jgi:NAD(P)-dependent dehydrogenase (short-subunit alcohol dehydrogenase family)